MSHMVSNYIYNINCREGSIVEYSVEEGSVRKDSAEEGAVEGS